MCKRLLSSSSLSHRSDLAVMPVWRPESGAMQNATNPATGS
jgi:hypothetical protein